MNNANQFSRRRFLAAGSAAGAGLLAVPLAGLHGEEAQEINLAIIGAGEHGRALIQAALGIPRLRFRAVCDIWEYRRRTASAFLKNYGQEVKEYGDYREMLERQKDLRGVIVATPDFAHAEQVNACLKAGLHVYCEKTMAHTLEAARSMVRTMKETSKLLQIGYQRASNPRYRHTCQNLFQKAKLTGIPTQVNAQFAHRVAEDLGWPKRQAMTDEALKPYGYANMNELRNWRNFRKFSAGVFADFGAQQVAVANWFLGVLPQTVTVSAGRDYYRDLEGFDNMMAVLEYPAPTGLVRALFQVITTSNSGLESHFEKFMGTEGTLQMSENPKWTKAFQEPYAADWDELVKQNHLVKDQSLQPPPEKETAEPEDPNAVHVRETGQVVGYQIPVVLDRPLHQPHLENWVAAMRGKETLNGSAEMAWPVEVLLHKINEAAVQRKTLSIKPEEFTV